MDIFSAYKCNKCGKIIYPKHEICNECGNREFTAFPLEGEAKLLTFTRLYNLPEGIDKEFLDFGIVEFENGIRVTGQLKLKSEAKTGMKLKAEKAVVRNIAGNDVYGFLFTET